MDYLPFIKSVVNTLPVTPNEYDDCVQSGYVGLLNASKQYNKDRGTFSTFAWLYVRWEVIRFIKQETYNVMTDHSPIYYTKSSIWEYFPDCLSYLEKSILLLKLKGYTFKEIAGTIHKSRGYASHVYQSAVTKIKNANT